MKTWLRGAIRVLPGALALALALSGCQQEQITADTIIERMKQSQQQFQNLHSTMAVDFVTNERNGTMLVENWSKSSGTNDTEGHPIKKQRVEVRQSTRAEQIGMTFVSDGQTVWLYSPAKNTVVTGSREDLEGLKDVARQNGGADNPALAIESFEDLIQVGLDSVTVEYLGDEPVGEQPAWKLKLTPKPQTDSTLPLEGLGGAMLWVDQQRALPLKLEVDAKDVGEGSFEATSLKTDPIDDSLFSFQIPAGAKVITLAELKAELTPQKVTLEQARQQAGFPLLTPGKLPEGTSLVDVTLFRRQGQPVIVQNYAGTVSFSLVQSRAEIGKDRQPPEGSQVQTVTVRGQQATLITNSGGEQGCMLLWQENGVTIIVAGPLTAQQALDLAENLQ